MPQVSVCGSGYSVRRRMGTVFDPERKRTGSPPPSRLDVTVRTWRHWLPVLRWVVAPDGERPEDTMPAFCANPGGMGIDAKTAWVQSHRQETICVRWYQRKGDCSRLAVGFNLNLSHNPPVPKRVHPNCAPAVLHRLTVAAVLVQRSAPCRHASRTATHFAGDSG